MSSYAHTTVSSGASTLLSSTASVDWRFIQVYIIMAAQTGFAHCEYQVKTKSLLKNKFFPVLTLLTKNGLNF